MPAAEEPTTAGARRRLGVGAAIVLVIASLAVTVAIGILRAGTSTTYEVPVAEVTEAAAAALYVHVSGAVRAPGLYVLASGARVLDAVAAAGGFDDDADRDAINLARAVTDGEQLIVLTTAEALAQPSDAPPSPGDGRVNLNTADEAALDTLPRVGPAMAQRILDWREQNGRFTSVDDLLAVPGIGDKMLAALRDLVTV